MNAMLQLWTFKDDYEPIINNTTFGITLARQNKKHLHLPITSFSTFLILSVLRISIGFNLNDSNNLQYFM
jgi:hypothetical protein